MSEVVRTLAEARDYKRQLAAELNRVTEFEKIAAIAAERDRQGVERLRLVRELGRSVYARKFEEMYGEAM